MLTDMQLRALKPTGKIYKVADQQGLYVAVTRTGVVSFRFDYRVNGRRETLVIGQYDPNLGAKKPRDLVDLDYGMSLTLAEARLLLTRAHRSVEQGESPSRTSDETNKDSGHILVLCAPGAGVGRTVRHGKAVAPDGDRCTGWQSQRRLERCRC